MTLPASPELHSAAARRAALEAAEAYVRSHIWALEDEAVNALYAELAAAHGRLTAALQQIFAQYVPGDTWTAADAAFQRRTDLLMEQIEAEMDRLAAVAADGTLARAVQAYQGGAAGRAYTLAQALRGTGVDPSIPLLPVAAIRAQLLQPYVGLTFLARFQDARDEFVRRIRRSLIGSQIEGDSIRDAIKRLARELGVDVSRRTAAARAANQALFSRLEMIVRTELLRASNTGAMATYTDNADVMEGWILGLTHDERTCPICVAANADDRVYPLGEGPQPPLHPRCLPGDSLVSAVGISAASKRWYDGNLIVICTTSGNDLASTPNHPILTPQGWIAAGQLYEGGHVVARLIGEGKGLGSYGNGDNMPARIEDIAESFGRSQHVTPAPVPLSPEDFHGDGEGSEVAVIWADSLLRNGIYSARGKHGAEFVFGGRDARARTLFPDGLGDLLFHSQLDTSNGIVGGLDLLSALTRTHSRPLQRFGLALPAPIYSGSDESAPDGWPANAVLDGDGIFRKPSDVIFDKIVNVKTIRFCGHVYNLQTESGMYVAQGIITHNCRCTPLPVIANESLRQRIVGPRETYAEWARRRGIGGDQDGGIFDRRGAPAPKSPSPDARAAAPGLMG